MSKQTLEQRVAALERVLKPLPDKREDESFGDRLRSARKMRHLTMDELCGDVGISKGFLSDLENGKRELGAGTLYRLARRLGFTMEYLWTGKL